MSPSFSAIPISKHVYWVGAIDWKVRDFHGQSTEKGSTYNAYLVMGEKITLVDTVRPAFTQELLERVASVVDPSRIDYIISNHAETDHSGALPAVIEATRPEKIFASTMGTKALSEHFNVDAPLVPVKDGETLSVGNLTVSFAETRMVHWPDSMFSFLHEDGVLFSNDAFGMHLATEERFIDEVRDWERHAAKYYANILMPLTPVVTRALDKVTATMPGIRVIAPDHGPIFRKDLDSILSLYAKWAAGAHARKAVVVYDTMWQSTAMMARSVANGLEIGGLRPKVFRLGDTHRSDIVTELLDAAALVVGSPTMNKNVFPTVADLLTYLKGLKPRNLVGAAFGSYGWSGEAPGQIREYLNAMEVALPREDLKTKFVPREVDLDLCVKLGSEVAEAALKAE